MVREHGCGAGLKFEEVIPDPLLIVATVRR